MLKKLTASRKQTHCWPVTGAIRAALMAAPGVLFAGAAIAGPFGFDLKSSVEPSRLYSFCEEFDDNWFNYYCTTAPKSHSDIEIYYVRFVQDVGLCSMLDIGKDIHDTRWGYETREKTDTIANQIRLKYGPYNEKIDDIYPRSALHGDPEDWMMSVLEEERYYGYVWTFFRPKNDIKEIRIFAEATSKDTGYFIVNFDTYLEDSCDKELD